MFRTYSKKDYGNSDFNFLINEKELILKALIVSKGSILKAYNLLCPEKKRFYTTDVVRRKIIQHQIKINMGTMKKDLNRVLKNKEACKSERESVLSPKVQKKLKALSIKNKDLNLRSLKE